MNIIQKLRHTARILSTRIQGHTTAAIAGAASNPLSLLVTSTMRHAQQIQSNHPNIDVTSIDRIDQILGRRGPVLIDHAAIAEITAEAATRIEALQAETERLETELAAASRDQQTLQIAKQTINDLQVQIAKEQAKSERIRTAALENVASVRVNYLRGEFTNANPPDVEQWISNLADRIDTATKAP